jgi:hypothetical protein
VRVVFDHPAVSTLDTVTAQARGADGGVPTLYHRATTDPASRLSRSLRWQALRAISGNGDGQHVNNRRVAGCAHPVGGRQLARVLRCT